MADTTEASLDNNASTGSILRGTASDLYNLTPIATAEWVLFDLLGPRGKEFRYDPKLAARARQEGRNPFCAQCHGPGGALDPNNSWNLRRSFEMRFGEFAPKR